MGKILLLPLLLASVIVCAQAWVDQELIGSQKRIIARNAQVAVLPTIAKEYRIVMDLFLTGSQKGWNQIVHFTTGGNNVNTYGNYIPAIWYHGTAGKIQVSSAVSGNANFNKAIKDISRNTWHTVEVSQENRGGKYHYSIVVNGNNVVSIVNTRPQIFSNVKVYAGSNWYTAQSGFIRKLNVYRKDGMCYGPTKCGKYGVCVGFEEGKVYCYGTNNGCPWGSKDCTVDADCSKYSSSSAKYTDGNQLDCLTTPRGWRSEACRCPNGVNGGWAKWGVWTRCSKECGMGLESRRRLCNDPAPKYGGRSCPGSSTYTQRCRIKLCPIHGKWSAWGAWNDCSHMCGPGDKDRRRYCNNPAPKNGGKDCGEQNFDFADCNIKPCPVNGNWAKWDEWSTCSHVCGGGLQYRSRRCNNPAPQHGGKTCRYNDGYDTQRCNKQSCPTHGKWSTWVPWSECSKTCGQGRKKRWRDCNNPIPSNGGEQCGPEAYYGRDVERGNQWNSCNIKPCPVHGKWSIWAAWGECNRGCGKGTQRRVRDCGNPAPKNGGKKCDGNVDQWQDCSNGPCPVHGGWSSWRAWSECSKTCGRGTQGRARVCDNPAPQHEGKKCGGDDNQSKDCNKGSCVVHGKWSTWGLWTECSVTCGKGTQQQSRTCTNPAPKLGGKNCDGSASKSRGCGKARCPPTCDLHNGRCQHKCTKVNNRATCSCDLGYVLAFDRRQCKECKDSRKARGMCQTYKNVGGCEIGAAIAARDICKLTCGVCVGKPHCKRMNGGCEHNCKMEVDKIECSCRNGFTLKKDKKHCAVCKDLDPTKCILYKISNLCDDRMWAAVVRERCKKSCGYCQAEKVTCEQDNGGCAHTCEVVKGEASCSCQDGYALLRDKKSCGPCRDRKRTCAAIVKTGHCKRKFIKKTCMVSCGVCKAGSDDTVAPAGDYRMRTYGTCATLSTIECKEIAELLGHIMMSEKPLKSTQSPPGCVLAAGKPKMVFYNAAATSVKCGKSVSGTPQHCLCKKVDKAKSRSLGGFDDEDEMPLGDDEFGEDDMPMGDDEFGPSARVCGRDKEFPDEWDDTDEDVGDGPQDERVVGGENAEPNRWEWQGGLYFFNQFGDEEFHCGGSLIAPNWFLTAAHCFTGKRNEKFHVKFGDHDRNKFEDGEQNVKVTKVTIHEGWGTNGFQHDLALLKLEKDVEMTRYVGTICLPEKDVDPALDSTCYITGWGKTHEFEPTAGVLQQAKLPIVSNEDCGKKNVDRNTKKSKILDTQICGGYLPPSEKMVSGCKGDSGGPYVCKKGNQWFLQGVVSWGSNKCDTNYKYTVFGRVNKYIDWIDANKV